MIIEPVSGKIKALRAVFLDGSHSIAFNGGLISLHKLGYRPFEIVVGARLPH